MPGRRKKIGDVRKGPLIFGNRYWRAETELLRTEKGANSWSRQERYQYKAARNVPNPERDCRYDIRRRAGPPRRPEVACS